MSDHFSLDVEPALLRTVAGRLQQLADHVRTKAAKVSATPGEIGDRWQGKAAESVKQNMTALGQQMNRYDEKLARAAEALRTLAEEYEHALEVRLPDLNRRYEQAQAAYDAAVQRAESAHATATADLSGPQGRLQREELGQVRSSAVNDAADDRRQAWHGLEVDFGYYRQYLAQRTRAASDALADAVVVPVSDAQVAEFRRRSASAGGPSPMRIGALERFDDTVFTLAGDANYAARGEEAARGLEELYADGQPSAAELSTYIDLVGTDNPAFRQALVENLDPAVLLQLQQWTHAMYGPEAEDAARVVTAIAEALAKGSNPRLQGDYPVSPGTYDKLIEAYESYGVVEGEGLMLLAEIIHAGQGTEQTWDSAVLLTAAEKVLAFEREHVAQDDYWSWMEVNRDFKPVTEHGRNSYYEQIPMDPLAMVLDAMHHDPEAAQDLLTAGGHADTDKLEYLYDRKAAGYYEAFGYTLGGLLDAATQFVGGGGPGTRDYVSAEIVNDLVSHYGEHPEHWRITMDQDVIDILTRFMPAVNHAGGAMGPVMPGDPDGQYSWQRLTLPNLDGESLGTVMELVLSTDYYTDDGSRPRFAQFAAVQQTAMQADFLEYAAQHGLDPGYLEKLVQRQGELRQRSIAWLTEAMKSQGAAEDESNKAARDAAAFIAGFATDQIPTGKLGPAGYVAGKGVEALKNAALDSWFPLTDHQTEMADLGLEQEIRERVNGANIYLNWLDQAGLIDGTANVDAYVTAHPDQTSFTVVGADGERHLRNIAQMHAEAKAAEEEGDFDAVEISRWNEFRTYWANEGGPFLAAADLDSNFQLGMLLGGVE